MSQVNPVNKPFCLEQLCASNYQKLFKLIPDLLSFKNRAVGYAADNRASLHLNIIEHTPYTLTVELSHSFPKNTGGLMAPAVEIRLYLDVQLAEVLRDHARDCVTNVYKDPGLTREIVNYKWRLNYFLQKWLDHCLKHDYQFTGHSLQPEVAV